MRKSKEGYQCTVKETRSKKGGYAAQGPIVENLRILDKAGTSLVDSQADSIAFIHILKLGDTQRCSKKGRDGTLTVNSLVLCRLSISSILSLTDCSFSSKPSSSTTSRAA
jgi:hypothetical protein